MICIACNERLELCPCEGTGKKLEDLKKCQFIDPQMILNIQMARASNKHVIAEKRASQKEAS